MKRKLLTLSLLTAFFGSSTLFASTYIGSSLTIDANWDASGNPYIIQSTVQVPPGVTLRVGPGVQVVFQGAATLEVGGILHVDGTASSPPIFNMTEGGLKSQLLINGGEARIDNARINGGVFLVYDGTLKMQGTDVTKGSGLYLKGDANVKLRNNKFFGNAAGLELDGEEVDADVQLNTFVQNTYGLYIKRYRKLNFVNNSIHDNTSEVVNTSNSLVRLDGNYWGTMSPKMVKDKVKGPVKTGEMKNIKSILRSVVLPDLPVITKKMSDDAEAEDIAEFKRQTAAYKKFKEQQRKAEMLKMEKKGKTEENPAPQAPPSDMSAPSEVPPPSEGMAPVPPSNEPSAPSATPAAVPSAAPSGIEPPTLQPPDINVPQEQPSSSATQAATPEAPQAPMPITTPVSTPATAVETTAPTPAATSQEPPMPASSKTETTTPPDSSLFIPMPPSESSAPASSSVPASSSSTPATATEIPKLDTTLPATAPASPSTSVLAPSSDSIAPPDLNPSLPASSVPVETPKSAATPVAPQTTAATAQTTPQNAPAKATPTPDADLEGLAPPPMDSGLDFNAPKK